jgi:hypothetical protein
MDEHDWLIATVKDADGNVIGLVQPACSPGVTGGRPEEAPARAPAGAPVD